MTIERRIHIVTSIMVLFILIIGSLLLWNSYEVENRIDHIGTSSQIVRSAFMLRTLMDEYLTHGNARPLRQWDRNYRLLGEIIHNAIGSQSIDQSLLKALEREYQALSSIHSQILELAASGDQRQDVKALTETFSGIMSVRLEELVNAAVRLHKDSQSLTLRRQKLAQILILATFILMIGVLVLNLYLIKRAIVRPLQELAAAADLSGTERLEQLVKAKRTGETGKLTETFNAIVERLKTIQDAVQSERQRLYDVLETLPVYVCLLDSDYRMPFANRYFRETFAESQGRRCHDFLFNRTEPCEICETYTVMKTRAPHHWYWTGPNGRDYDIYDFPFIDSDGSRLILEMGIDITERKRAEEALREASAYNRILIEASLDPLVTISAEGKITDVNTATERVTGLSREELLGTDFADYFTDPGKARMGYEKVFRDGLVKNYELAIRHKKGWLTPVMYNASLYRDDSGKIVGVFAAARDISDRKRAEDELIRSNEDLQQFAYVASHDLQEPLRNVASCLQLLEKEYKNKLDANADQYINYAVEGAVRMKTLILDLLAYSRIVTRGKQPERIESEQILVRTMMNLGLAIAEAGAVITHDPLPAIYGDDTQLLQVFQNLIGNAIKFRRDEPPKVHVSAAKNANEWIFSVKDNGVGIESRHLDRIFAIFQRLHKRSEYDGTGMGLAIVKKIVERHRGRIWVESEPGVGTTFYFTIPEKGLQI